MVPFLPEPQGFASPSEAAASTPNKLPTHVEELEDMVGSFTLAEENETSERPTPRERRPSTPRSVTDPTGGFRLQPQQPLRPRPRSPYSRSHLRSHSSSGTTTAPPMTRAHSLPTFHPARELHSLSPSPRPLSPSKSPSRTRSPFSMASDDNPHLSAAPSVCDIEEDAELDFTPRAEPLGSPLASLSHGNTFPRRRRPASPLHQISSSSFGSSSASSSMQSSPRLDAVRFNEPFPGVPASFYSSSVPSTPTSARSRSPSISSLETIPDEADAEEAAIEADRIARLNAPPQNKAEEGRTARTIGVGFGGRDKRKRWSVCGAERRGDLDVIWEDGATS